ncbi:RWD domain-containing protein 4 [Onthophagus taurus]|uniref:RWD domain-containing protein 4 n=1 Tax=Onthophagus taurus TaxID=166361 RepID=UPI0039BE4ED9
MSEEVQEEEREVLLSIYDGDTNFKQVSPTVFQYKYGNNDEPKSFLLELKWGDKYPDEKPDVNMDTFYNKHVIPSLKEKIANLVAEEAEQYLGMSMTYSLFEFIKEKFEQLIEEQPEHPIEQCVEKMSICENQDIPKKCIKKEHLTKAQKRRQWDKVDSKGEKPRGWNWVDIVKHLSQTGSKDDSAPTS